jgi:hypothetical protein
MKVGIIFFGIFVSDAEGWSFDVSELFRKLDENCQHFECLHRTS